MRPVADFSDKRFHNFFLLGVYLARGTLHLHSSELGWLAGLGASGLIHDSPGRTVPINVSKLILDDHVKSPVTHDHDFR